MEKSLMICVNRRLLESSPSCAGRGSQELAERIEHRIGSEDLAVTVQRLPCLGYCEEGPVMRLSPGGKFLLGMGEEQIMQQVRAFAAQKVRQAQTTD